MYDVLLIRIVDKIRDVTLIDDVNYESFQVLRYENGQFYNVNILLSTLLCLLFLLLFLFSIRVYIRSYLLTVLFTTIALSLPCLLTYWLAGELLFLLLTRIACLLPAICLARMC
jgi:hypothetical protein